MAELLARGHNALANHHDKSRMIGRHEALLDLERMTEERSVDKALPSVDAVPIIESLTPEKNTRWRIG